MGSIPASRAKITSHQLSKILETRAAPCDAGFLLSRAISVAIMEYRQFNGIEDGIYDLGSQNTVRRAP
ncbi:MAG TPA: hypothetical protein PKE15_02890 [Ottowia sp.]|nr:hypothetical protein [Ottowia sp.]